MWILVILLILYIGIIAYNSCKLDKLLNKMDGFDRPSLKRSIINIIFSMCLCSMVFVLLLFVLIIL